MRLPCRSAPLLRITTKKQKTLTLRLLKITYKKREIKSQVKKNKPTNNYTIKQSIVIILQEKTGYIVSGLGLVLTEACTSTSFDASPAVVELTGLPE